MGFGPTIEVGSFPSIKKKEFLVQSCEQFPQMLTFTLLQQNVTLLDEITLRSEIELTFKITGKPWKNKQDRILYISNLVCFKIEEIDAHPTGKFPNFLNL